MKKLLKVALMNLLLFLITATHVYAGETEIWTTKQNVESTKVWSIKLNMELEQFTKVDNKIIITDSKGNEVDVDLEFIDKAIRILPPECDYKAGETYILKINNLLSKDGKVIKSNVVMSFTIKTDSASKTTHRRISNVLKATFEVSEK